MPALLVAQVLLVRRGLLVSLPELQVERRVPAMVLQEQSGPVASVAEPVPEASLAKSAGQVPVPSSERVPCMAALRRTLSDHRRSIESTRSFRRPD